MSVLLLPLIILATLLVILSGLWVTVALIAAVWRVDRRTESAGVLPAAQDARDPGKNLE